MPWIFINYPRHMEWWKYQKSTTLSPHCHAQPLRNDSNSLCMKTKACSWIITKIFPSLILVDQKLLSSVKLVSMTVKNDGDWLEAASDGYKEILVNNSKPQAYSIQTWGLHVLVPPAFGPIFSSIHHSHGEQLSIFSLGKRVL